MNLLEIDCVSKRFENHKALNEATFNVPESTIFGLLGPNGAGKTTLIRIITNIIAPDSGEVRIEGKRSENFNMKDKIGYMPEERGLYRKMKVGEQLLYLAQLRGMKMREARDKIVFWLERLDAKDWWNKTIDELSKGMSQKVQFISTVMHDPKLIILDEPFSGLDPINANLIKNEIFYLKNQGASILFSTHRMEQVEEICNDIVLVNKGKIIISGDVAEIKNRFKKNSIALQYAGNAGFEANMNVEIVKSEPGCITVMLHDVNMNYLLNWAMNSGNTVVSVNEILPTINEIFIDQVGSVKP
jgi:ABC-2 type transport system ATP-binding protein